MAQNTDILLNGNHGGSGITCDKCPDCDPNANRVSCANINCDLEVGLRPENIAVYVVKGKKQCFNFTSLKCCCNGDITIQYCSGADPKATRSGKIEVDKFGEFFMNKSGICFEPDDDLGKFGSPTSAYLTFKATAITKNGCENTVCFVVNFIYDPCRFCCKSRKC